MVLLATPSLAINYVWTNVAASDWSTPGNWSPNGIPGTNDCAYLTNRTTAPYTVILTNTIGGLNLGGITNTGLAGLVLSNAQYTVTLLITNCWLWTTGAAPGVVFSSNSVLEVDNLGVFTNSFVKGVKIACTNFVLKLGNGGLYQTGAGVEAGLVPSLGPAITTIQSSSAGVGGVFSIGSSGGYWGPAAATPFYNSTVCMCYLSRMRSRSMGHRSFTPRSSTLCRIPDA